MLKPEIQARILAMHFSEKRPVRAIAKALGINRKSVAAVVVRRSVRNEPVRQAFRQTPAMAGGPDP